jgi:hypothetical protein
MGVYLQCQRVNLPLRRLAYPIDHPELDNRIRKIVREAGSSIGKSEPPKAGRYGPSPPFTKPGPPLRIESDPDGELPLFTIGRRIVRTEVAGYGQNGASSKKGRKHRLRAEFYVHRPALTNQPAP